MSLGSFLKKLVPIAKTAGTIVVTDGVGGTAAATAFRQVLTVAGTALAGHGYLADNQVQSAVGAVMTLGAIVYGQLKTIKEKQEKVIIADAAPDTAAVVK